jgi:hypothetical protein
MPPSREGNEIAMKMFLCLLYGSTEYFQGIFLSIYFLIPFVFHYVCCCIRRSNKEC